MTSYAKAADTLFERRRYVREEILELAVVQLTLLQISPPETVKL